jgi:vitamin B12/bleomycin/antimicrobial peptide transport system ATP-binding/permease protein
MHLFTKTSTRSWQLLFSYWYSKEALAAWGLLATTMILIFGIVGLDLYINSWQANFYNQLQSYDHKGFIQALINFVMIAIIYIVISGYQLFFQMKLQIHWRKWLTNHYVSQWLQNKTYYFINLLPDNTDNPDQRISDDIHLLVSQSLQLFLGLLKQMATLCSFLCILWQLSGSLTLLINRNSLTIPGYLIWASLGYSILGTWVTAKIGHPLIRLNISQQRCEADFRYSLVRIRENDESIAVYHGEYPEKKYLTTRFQKIYDNYKKIAAATKHLTWFTTGYFQLSIVFAFFVASPRYFNHEIQLGQLFEISGAYWYVHAALSYIVKSFTTLAEWQSVFIRLSQFIHNMHHTQEYLTVPQSLKIHCSSSSALIISHLTIYTPTRQALLNDLSLQLKPKNHLLITGPSGHGKSTLLRTIAGIWPFAQGNIQIPDKQSWLFLPQKAYIPLSTLQDILLYPRLTHSVPADKLQKVLLLCHLSALTQQLDQAKNWSKILSLGEQQSLALARALLHKPDWLLLDEATSALESSSQDYFYSILQRYLPNTVLISVGHRELLEKFHTLKLELLGSEKWQLSKL